MGSFWHGFITFLIIMAVLLLIAIAEGYREQKAPESASYDVTEDMIKLPEVCEAPANYKVDFVRDMEFTGGRFVPVHEYTARVRDLQYRYRRLRMRAKLKGIEIEEYYVR